jgi:hypothetical protein
VEVRNEEVRIERTGKPALRFDGQVVAQSNGHWAGGREQNRWHDLRLYRTDGGQWVLHIEYSTYWEGELEHVWAEQVADVRQALASYDPCQVLVGAGASIEKAKHWVARRYDEQVRELLSGVRDADEVIK